MVLSFLCVLLGAFVITWINWRDLKGNRKLQVVFYTVLAIATTYGALYALRLEVPSIARWLTSLVKSV
ncbi:hypothetical protein J26TS2_35720 [Shouchella clausii]|nr:hypothetical protein J26TS2_35720 [Shouchella clausii]